MTIHQIADTNLYVGNSNDARDIDNLRRLGIKRVLNVATDLEGPWFHGDYRNYKIPLTDGPGNQLYQYQLALYTATTILSHGEKLLIHCHAGISRSPSIAAACLVFLKKARTIEEALQIVKRHRPEANPAPIHIQELKKIL